MTDRAHPLRLPLLAVWSLAPVLLLGLRALGRGWQYPHLWPQPLDWTRLADAFANRRLTSALLTSLGLALVVGSVGSLAGFAVARATARASRRIDRVVTALALFCVVVPPMALGVGLQVAMIGLGLSGTMGGVGLAHLVPAVGYLTLFARGVFGALDLAVEEEARTLGATRWQVLTRVTVPMLKDRLAEGLVLGALVSWGQLAITALVGGGVVRTLPLELLAFVRSGDDQLGAAASLVLTGPPLLALGLLRVATRRSGVAGL